MERKKGVIIRVSGPLVVFRGLEGIKMHEVVKVGKLGIIGEVVEIRGEDVYVQVYEETAGIGPGEEVERTYMPLSVELGPGLLTTIYDGIQRPLEKIKEKYGSYIERGITLPGLDRDKQWEFVPLKKEGDEVSEGDIIGEVQETVAIRHKIFVPYGVKGKIQKIEKGKFRVTDVVCIISDGKEKREITMLKKWPVRKSRRYIKKLPTDEPLITGTRVIDTFFTITKGGTAAIPGPFGSGKCVSPDTPVLTENGEILSIEEIYEKYKNKGRMFNKGFEEYTILNENLKVYGYLNGKIRKFRVNAVYKGKTKAMIRIRTRSGRDFKVTPIHKLFRYSNVEIEKKEARFFKVGDYIIMPRSISCGGLNNRMLPWRNIFRKYRISEDKLKERFSKVLARLKDKYRTLKEIAERLSLNYDTLISYYSKKNAVPLEIFLKVFELAEMPVPEIKYLKGDTNSQPVKIPKSIDEKLALFLGLLVGDGQIKGRSIRFYNNDKEVKKLFIELTKQIFSFTPKEYKMRTVEVLVIESPVIKELLKFFGFPEYKKSNTVEIPRFLINSGRNNIAHFLSGIFMTDGYFNAKKGEIELSTSSKKLLTGISYMLLFLGIKATFRFRKSGRYKSWRIFIRGKDEIKKFYKYCNFQTEKYKNLKKYIFSKRKEYNSWDIVPMERNFIEEVYTTLKYNELKEKGIEIFNYTSGENMGRKVFEEFALMSGNENLIKFAFNHLGSFFIDKIVDIEWINKEIDVYDLEVEKAHNFIGGQIPSFFSNTVVLHQLAKWSDADIIVYIGCGERGNEMTDVLIEFPELEDPRTKRPLLERTVLIANTSNMPVAAREASIYTGITIAEYFRDMGYRVALMADSTSRWAEALREMSGRMEEMPGEEGYPAYLGTRIAEFYERAGKVICLGSDKRIGTLSVIGAVSPPGGDLSDPVVQNTLRVVKVFWSLEDKLAFQRHFPAISWLRSYSLYIDNIEEWSKKNLGEDFVKLRAKSLEILQKEASLEEIVRLVGIDALSEDDKLILDTAKILREDFLSQHAFDPDDTYTFFDMQYRMLRIIIRFHLKLKQLISLGRKLQDFKEIDLRHKIARMKYTKYEKYKEEFEKIEKEIGGLQ